MKKTGNIEAIYPLSPMQEGILFHALYAPQTMGYFEQSSTTLEGDVNVPAFERAWQTVVDRHPILRTLFTWEKQNQPLQIVRQKAQIPFVYLDWRSYSPSEQQARLETFLISDRRQGFNLSKAPLMRLALMRLNERHHQFTWSFHHLLLDGWSGPIVISEFFTLYEGFCRNENPVLPHRRPYRDYIGWLQQQDLTQTEQFWRAYLNGFTKPTPFCVDERNAEDQTEAYAEQKFVLSETESGLLQRLVQENRLTMGTFIQGVWAIILSRYSNERDVVFGTTVSGRAAPLEDIENMVGLFINTLPIRVQVTPEVSFLEWLQSLQTQQTEMRLYEHSPLTYIQQCSSVPAREPLFESILVMDDYPMPQPAETMQRSLKIREVRVFEQTNYPLSIQVVPGVQLLWQLKYDCHRFTDAIITSMLGHIQTLLEGIVANPNRPLGELPWLTETERQQLLVDWNDTKVDYPKDGCIHELFEKQVQRTPDAIAAFFGKQMVSYWELNRRANQLASHLQTLGVGPEVLVGVCTERSIEMLIGLLGVLKAGGAYVPLDLRYPKDRLSFMLQDSGASLLLTQKRLLGALPGHKGKVICLDSDWKIISEKSDTNVDKDAVSADLAYVMYTSGSTGKPKGVFGLHRGAINRFHWMWRKYPFAKDEICCQKTALGFVDSVWEIFGPLLQGKSLVIVPDEVIKDTKRFIQTLAKYQVLRIVLVPSLLRVMLDLFPNLQLQLPDLKFWFSSGETLPVELAQQFAEAMPDSTLVNLYGSSEVSADSTWHQIGKDKSLRSVPIGQPIANTQIYLLDQYMQPVPIGVPGELYISGDGLARGYLNRPELTEKAFVSNPFCNKADSRLFKTGDLGRWIADGNIEFLGRIDHQVKIRGFRIELGEVETVLKHHPDVGEAVVIAREDLSDEKRIVAYFVSCGKHAPSIDVLRRFLKSKLPDYMVPSTFVFLDAMPLMPNGKLDRHALPAPGKIRQEPTTSSVKPRDELELQLTKIWEKVLGVKHIGMEDNFFDLGGHSLLAVRLFARIQKIFGKDIPLATLFQAPTIEQLARIVRQEGLTAPWSSLVPIQPVGSKLPLFCVHGCGGRVLHLYDLARHLGQDQPFYGLRGHGLEKGEAFHARIEHMASDYIKEIQTIQPEGPYFISGSGDGGAIVLEMAQQLESQGQNVALLILIDPVTPRPDLSHFKYSLYIYGGSLKHFFHRLAHFIQENRPFIPAVQHAFFNRVLMRWKISQRFVPASIHRQHRFRDAFRAALLNYTPQVYSGRIRCFLREETNSIRQQRIGDWSDIAAGGLDVRLVPGGLMSMYREPHVQVLAKQIKDCLDMEEMSG